MYTVYSLISSLFLHILFHRLKEELIRELVKNGNTVKQMNKSFRKKVSTLEEEASQLRHQLRPDRHKQKFLLC